MELESIIYFYPMREEDGKAGRRAAAKKHWFQEAALKAEGFGEGRVIGCAVPPFYYKKKSWKPQALSETMETVLSCGTGMVDTYVHPQIEAMLTEEYRRRWLPRKDTMQMLIGNLIEENADSVIRRCGTATILLGEPVDTDWQMEMTLELLRPYLPKINRLTIFYEELAGADVWTELGSYLDAYYYEYGLVPQMEPYNVIGVSASSMNQEVSGQFSDRERTSALRCGKAKCCGMILDYGAGYRYPKISSESVTVYIDAVSAVEKEQALKRKTPQIPYVSPLKYLDTMVKNSYDG